MATTLDLLKEINHYPTPVAVIEEIAKSRGLALDATVTADVILSAEYNLACADLMQWLSLAPSVSQGGQSYTFSDEQRRWFRQDASAIYDRFKTESIVRKTKYGYKGSRL